jgi:hypothetical protein
MQMNSRRLDLVPSLTWHKQPPIWHRPINHWITVINKKNTMWVWNLSNQLRADLPLNLPLELFKMVGYEMGYENS